jgi:hypothetical protein
MIRIASLSLAGVALLTQLPAQQSAAPSPTGPTCSITRPPLLPQAVTSFGACRSGPWLYVFGGHIGRQHAHSRANVVGTFVRCDLDAGTDWQVLPDGPPVQGTALVAAGDGSVYRVGGMTAHNAPEADEDLHSTASVARFCPRAGCWQELTPLPEPRSSHDAYVLGDRLHVVGGWRLSGSSDGEWATTAWVADLRQQPLQWQPLPCPGPRRACALGAVQGQLVVLGGMDANGPLASVQVLDAGTGSWRPAPDLPGMAFGTAAWADGGQLYCTVMDGRLLAWDGTAPAFCETAQLSTPRFFHRLVAAGERRLLALGGANRNGHLRSCEFVPLDGEGKFAIEEQRLRAPTRIAHRQALLLAGDVLWAFGGNRGTGSDRLAADQLAADIWRLDLPTMAVTTAGQLPHGCQSMAVASWGEPRRHALVGGLGTPTPDGPVRSLAAAFGFDPRTGTLQPLGPLPQPRTQGELVGCGDRLWLFGGVDFTPSADGGTIAGDAAAVFRCELGSPEPGFTAADLQLPRPRRSFATAQLGNELFLIGGLGHDFAPAGPVDVLELATETWRQLELPRPWVSPQAAVLGDRIYLACGGTMQGQRFTADRSLWSWSAAEGFQEQLAELPFAVRHVQMLAVRDRLLFYAIEGDEIVLRWLRLPPPPTAARRPVEASWRHG